MPPRSETAAPDNFGAQRDENRWGHRRNRDAPMDPLGIRAALLEHPV